MISIVEVLKTLCEKILYLNKELVSETTFQSICSAEKLENINPYNEKGTNAFYRIGNILRGNFSVPSVGLGAGNIENVSVTDPIIQLNTDTEPFFIKINGNAFISGGYGSVCTLEISASDVYNSMHDEKNNIDLYNICGFGIYATATHAAISGTLSSYYYTTVNFNTNYFDDKE